MRVAVTGAAGHVGANLVRTLVAAGVKVRALAHHDRRALEGVAVELADGDVLDPQSLVRAFDGVERVYHLAARISVAPGDEAEVQAINVDGVRNVVEACLRTGAKRLLHMSSIHALSAYPMDRVIDEQRPLAEGDDLMPYDQSKSAGERELRKGLERGLDAVVVNPTAILGPYDFRPSKMGEVLLDLYHRRLPALVHGGFDWVDVRDVVAGAIAAADRGKTGERYLLSGERKSVRELAGLVEEITAIPRPRITSPMWLARAAAPFATALARATGKEPLFTRASLHALRHHQHVSHAKATRELDYHPRPLRNTLIDTFDWFRTAGMLSPPGRPNHRAAADTSHG
jgi:dihydroflavonol-4-reductase